MTIKGAFYSTGARLVTAEKAAHRLSLGFKICIICMGLYLVIGFIVAQILPFNYPEAKYIYPILLCLFLILLGVTYIFHQQSKHLLKMGKRAAFIEGISEQALKDILLSTLGELGISSIKVEMRHETVLFVVSDYPMYVTQFGTVTLKNMRKNLFLELSQPFYDSFPNTLELIYAKLKVSPE